MFQDGRSESHLIAPAPGWEDWDAAAEAIHGLCRATLVADGETHEFVASRMVETLTGHDLFASAPSWDGKWLSVLLRAAGHPRRALRLRDTDDALWDTVEEILTPVVTPGRLPIEVHAIVSKANAGRARIPAHRALADVQCEQAAWLRARDSARAFVAAL